VLVYNNYICAPAVCCSLHFQVTALLFFINYYYVLFITCSPMHCLSLRSGKTNQDDRKKSL